MVALAHGSWLEHCRIHSQAGGIAVRETAEYRGIGREIILGKVWHDATFCPLYDVEHYGIPESDVLSGPGVFYQPLALYFQDAVGAEPAGVNTRCWFAGL